MIPIEEDSVIFESEDGRTRLDAEVAADEDSPGSIQDLRPQLSGSQEARAEAAFQMAAREEAEIDQRAAKAGLYHGSEERLHDVVTSSLSSEEAASLSGSEPRYGERLRGERLERERIGQHLTPAGFVHLADAIDRDAAYLRERAFIEGLRHARETLRRQVEEAVGRLKYPVERPRTGSQAVPVSLTTAGVSFRMEPVEPDAADVLDADAFLAELDVIFGDRGEQAGARAHPDAKFFEIPGHEGAAGLRVAVNPDGEAMLWPIDPAVGDSFALHPVAARDLALLLTTQLPEGPFSFAIAVPAECFEGHEPAPSPGFDFFECPECGFSSVQPEAFDGSAACPLCAGDSGHDVRMSRRACRADDKPEGFDARTGDRSLRGRAFARARPHQILASERSSAICPRLRK